jgi:hypothetical protein
MKWTPQKRMTSASALRRLRHEVDAAEQDDVGVGLLGGLGELERIPDDVGDVLDVGLLVVVRQDDGVALAAERVDGAEEIVGKSFHAAA